MIKYALLTVIAGISLANCASVPSSSTLYDQLGGTYGLTRIVSGTLDYTLADPRIAHTFENSNVERVEGLIVEQLCNLSGGPCDYTGQTMARSHRGLELTSAHFNALVENMQKAMEDEGIAFRTQNQLLALLAPMHDSVIGRSDKY